MQSMLDRILGHGLDENEVDPEEAQHRRTLGFARQQHLAGLGRMKYPTAGQERRREARARARVQRKNRNRQVRDVHRNRQARATLQGQLDVLARTGPAGQRYLDAHLSERYGSVSAAIAHAAQIGLEVPQGAVEYAASAQAGLGIPQAG